MENTMELTKEGQKVTFLTAEALLEHWQGHRRLTRKLIAAFPDDKLFTYSIGGDAAFRRAGNGNIAYGPPGDKRSSGTNLAKLE